MKVTLIITEWYGGDEHCIQERFDPEVIDAANCDLLKLRYRVMRKTLERSLKYKEDERHRMAQSKQASPMQDL